MATISNHTSDALVLGTSNADSIRNYVLSKSYLGDRATVDAGDGDDTINNDGNNVTIDGGAGDDLITDIGEFNSINGGAGNDSIYNEFGSYMTIRGGAGNDYISSDESSSFDNLYQYSSGDGNDTIEGFDDNDTLEIGGGTGTYSKKIVDLDIVITVGDGKITLVGAESLSTLNIDGEEVTTGGGDSKLITLTEGDDYYSNSVDSATIVALGGDDSIHNNGWYSTIDGGEGNDKINNEGSDVSIDSGAGNDRIENHDNSKVSIDLGAGDDSINNWNNSYVSIDGGSGNDSISNDGDNVSINSGAGNDYIYNHHTDDYGFGNASGNKVTINAGDGDDTISNDGSNVTINGSDGDDSISIDDSCVNLIQYIEGDGNDTIQNFNEHATLSIGDGTGTYSKDTVGNDIIITVGDGKITLVGAADLETLNIDGKEQSSDTLILTNDDAAKITLPAQIVTADATARTKAIRIVGNALDNSIFGGTSKDSLYGGNGDDYISGGKGNDKLYGQNDDDTLYGGSGNDTLSGGKGNDVFIYSSGNDLITDYEVGDKISLGAAVSNATVDGSDVILTVGKYTLTVKDAKYQELALIDKTGKESTLRVGGTIYDDTSAAKVTLDADVEFADASSRTAAIRIVGNALDNSILGGSGKDTLYGKNGDDYLFGGAGNDKLYGQSGDDTLYGGTGNDTLSGGLGEDLFIYDSGNDVITDYEVGDKISLGAAIDNVSLKGNDAVLTVGKNKLTIKNAKYQELTLIDATGKETTQHVGATIFDSTAAAKVTLDADVEFADASSRTKAIRLVGNALDNSILGGSSKDSLYGGDGNDFIQGGKGNDKLYGQNGDDTLWGGLGNDTLTGGDGADKFLYEDGDGDDVISGFDKNDMLLITGAFTASYDKTADTIAFQVGSGSITLKDFTATTFNVNGYNYRVKGSKLVK